MEKFGLKVRELREKHGHTREELANKLGLSESALGKYERGERSIKPDLLEKVADIYDVKVSIFYGEEGELPPELKAKGAKWITFINEMEERKLTPEQIKATLEFLNQFNFPKKD